MILFPIVLMAILGAAFSGSFADNFQYDQVRVLYAAKGEKELNANFRLFLTEIQKDTGITFDRNNRGRGKE